MFFLQLLLQEGPSLKSKGKASIATRIAVLTWRSLLIMSREWKYYWLRLILYMLLTLCIGTVFSGLGHSLSSVGVSFITWTPLHCKHNRCWFELVIQPLGLNSLNFLTYVITLAFTCFILFYLLNFFLRSLVTVTLTYILFLLPITMAYAILGHIWLFQPISVS